MIKPFLFGTERRGKGLTRQFHDQFAKQYLEELLSPLGTVEISKEVSDETRQVDVFFSSEFWV